ncbi:type II secretion system F family protein [Novosphingobium mangrovi (ex Huang et al. 2023)]|uniref:Type II secretion system F family protein n=1 Tax=Novosphingobium mangrovi (ex Huang et al. 2023) TaxID=2976432 RepID=A0ABT2I5G5_9SPHN|nr:type II secretion system F family protein [Novosphingobium mangrovi (ex Huang et al. 2023)]MCT2400066.1 type II secretion system F family protein [Novosphingobium mangrovi (ex Huang et al. 2023)]
MFDGQLFRALIFVAIFGSVFLFVQLVLRLGLEGRAHRQAVNKRLRMISTGAEREDVVARLLKNDPTFGPNATGFVAKSLRNLRKKLLMAGLPFGPTETMFGMIGLFVFFGLGAWYLAFIYSFPITFGVLQLIIAVAAGAAIAIPLQIISVFAQRRRKRMQAQFPVALDIFVRALKAGHPVASALDLMTNEMEDPIGSEFGLVGDEISYGAELTEALDAMAERWDLDDIRMFVVSLSVQNETGGNLAEILENLSEVIRERATLLLKVRALSSEGRMTGWLLTVLPILTFLALFLTDPSFYFDVAMDPIFYIGFPMIIALFLLGVLWIRKLVDLKV